MLPEAFASSSRMSSMRPPPFPLITPSASPPVLRSFTTPTIRPLDGRSPAKKRRLSQTPSFATTGSTNRIHLTPTSSSCSTADLDTPSDIHDARRASISKVLNIWSQLAEKHSRRLDEDDIINLEDGTLIRDRGVILGSAHRSWEIGCFADGQHSHNEKEQDSDGGEVQEDLEEDFDELDAFADIPPSNSPLAEESTGGDDLELKRLTRLVPPIQKHNPQDAADLREFLEAEHHIRELFGGCDDEDYRSDVEYLGHDSGMDESGSDVDGNRSETNVEEEFESKSQERQSNDIMERPCYSDDDGSSYGATAVENEAHHHSPENEVLLYKPAERSLSLPLEEESDDELGAWDLDEGSAVYNVVPDCDIDGNLENVTQALDRASASTLSSSRSTVESKIHALRHEKLKVTSSAQSTIGRSIQMQIQDTVCSTKKDGLPPESLTGKKRKRRTSTEYVREGNVDENPFPFSNLKRDIRSSALSSSPSLGSRSPVQSDHEAADSGYGSNKHSLRQSIRPPHPVPIHHPYNISSYEQSPSPPSANTRSHSRNPQLRLDPYLADVNALLAQTLHTLSVLVGRTVYRPLPVGSQSSEQDSGQWEPPIPSPTGYRSWPPFTPPSRRYGSSHASGSSATAPPSSLALSESPPSPPSSPSHRRTPIRGRSKPSPREAETDSPKSALRINSSRNQTRSRGSVRRVSFAHNPEIIDNVDGEPQQYMTEQGSPKRGLPKRGLPKRGTRESASPNEVRTSGGGEDLSPLRGRGGRLRSLSRSSDVEASPSPKTPNLRLHDVKGKGRMTDSHHVPETRTSIRAQTPGPPGRTQRLKKS